VVAELPMVGNISTSSPGANMSVCFHQTTVEPVVNRQDNDLDCGLIYVRHTSTLVHSGTEWAILRVASVLVCPYQRLLWSCMLNCTLLLTL